MAYNDCAEMHSRWGSMNTKCALVGARRSDPQDLQLAISLAQTLEKTKRPLRCGYRNSCSGQTERERIVRQVQKWD